MSSIRHRLARSLGLRARMTASYMLVTFAAVLLVEGLAAALVIPNVNKEADLSSRVVNTANRVANDYAGLLIKSAAQAKQDLTGTSAVSDTSVPAATASPAPKDQGAGTLSVPTTTASPPSERIPMVSAVDPAVGSVMGRMVRQACQDTGLGTPGATLSPGQEQDQGSEVLIPQVAGLFSDGSPMSMAVLLDAQGLVLCSSYPKRFQPGSEIGPRLPRGWEKGIGAVTKTSAGKVAWASQMIFWKDPSKLGPLPDPARKGGQGTIAPAPLLGYVYVQAPVPPGGLSWTDLTPLLRSGLIFLGATIPVGVIFGTLTTSGVIKRLRRLVAGTVGFAAGDFSHRVPEAGADEVGQLERHFNQMAGRLEESIAEQRTLAEKNARLAERSRISRELHDSISQDLFSISALVGGLRKALPADSSVQPQLETLNQTVGSTIQEMRALLLELRPTALEEKGLVPALADLCEAYEARVGVQVRRELTPMVLDPAVEQAVFRIAQEGLSNAVRHSEAEEIRVRLQQAGQQAELTVADNGHGFDRDAAAGHGLGLRLMAERIRELGGSLAIDSEPGRGTSLRVLLPTAGPATG